MEISGIVCEYNPLNLGHQKQIDFLRQQGHAVVCVMSGNFVQRGHPAIFDKMKRAQAAVACGADLVIELPVNYAIASAEGFAAGAVEILSRLCDNICFGAETADGDALLETAKTLLQPDFSQQLRSHLDKGLSFPAARAAAITDCGLDGKLLASPNNILAVEYCKAILTQNAHLKPIVLHRGGNYHDLAADTQNPSATSLRQLIENGKEWANYIPVEAAAIFAGAPVHTLQQSEKAILYRLRTMTDGEFAALPYGSEGLWRKLMHAGRQFASLEEIITATKSKRYTRTRIDRMILCAYLGITLEMMQSTPPYARVLAFSDTGRSILTRVRDSGYFVNIGQRTGHSWEETENRCGALYALMALAPEAPECERNYRVFYRK